MGGSAGNAEEKARGGLHRILWNRFGHLRAGWRLIVYGVVATVMGIGLSWPVGLLLPAGVEEDITTWAGILAMTPAMVALVVSGLLVLRFVDHRPPALLGLGLAPDWWREALIGLGAGVALVSAEAAVLVVTGGVRIQVAADPGAGLAALPRCAALFTVAGAMEELLFRGYPLQVLAEGTRRWLAAVVLCVLFALGHLGNPDIGPLPVVNIFLLGLLLAAAYLSTRRLWLPIALHLSWNLAQSWLWGFDVSGITLPDTLLVAVPIGPEALTGGGFGLEGSLLTTLTVAATLAWLMVRRPLEPVREVGEAWRAYPPGFGRPPHGTRDQEAADSGGTR